jgi:NTE family protein
VRDRISYDHLLASSAIPFVFPAKPLLFEGNTEYFGDGSMRQSAPVAAAIHLGAEKVLVIGAGRMAEPRKPGPKEATNSYPSIAQIAGHALSSIFLDSLAVDVERVRRINQTMKLIPPEVRSASPLRPVELLVISPSERLDSVAARHIGDLPPAVRALLGGVGVSTAKADAKGSALASYLLFESKFTQELMAMGYADALLQKNEICEFFAWTLPVEHRVETVRPDWMDRRKDPLRL